MSAPLVVTLGCRLNAFESQVIRREAAAVGSDAVIINTCAVTGEAVRQARQAIRRLRRDHPGRPLIVTGCAAQLDPAAFAAMPEVDRVLGNAEKLDRAALGGDAAMAVTDVAALRETTGHLLDGFEGRSRAFVEVQQGCDHRCTFCIIPFARGANRSVPQPLVVERVRALAQAGWREVVLTGVDLCSWGFDLPEQPRLGALVRSILHEVPELPRLRLSSLDPAAIDAEVFAALAEEPRLMPHLHLSVQAMDDLVLKRMRRRHARAQVLEVCARARDARPDVVFGADLIAGFPTESEAMFAATLAAVTEAPFTYLHVFPFSPRPGTPAARMPQVAAGERRARAARLRAAGEAVRTRFFAGRVGEHCEVLAETPWTARCPHYAPVTLATPVEPGSLVSVRLHAADSERLYAECAT